MNGDNPGLSPPIGGRLSYNQDRNEKTKKNKPFKTHSDIIPPGGAAVKCITIAHPPVITYYSQLTGKNVSRETFVKEKREYDIP